MTMLVSFYSLPNPHLLTIGDKHYYPIIYALNDPEPLAICTGRNLPGGSPVPPEQRTYCNISTMKVGTRNFSIAYDHI